MEAGEGMASTFMKEEVTEWVAFEPVSALIQLSAEFGYTTHGRLSRAVVLGFDARGWRWYLSPSAGPGNMQLDKEP